MVSMTNATDDFRRLAAVAALTALSFGVAFAQTPATLGSGSAQGADTEWTALSAAEIEELIGPIALYPDDLVAIVLPASTFPLQIVQASRALEQAQADTEIEPDAAWDESVVALLNYPEVLQLLNDDLDWTWALGEAVIYQQGDVLNAVQAFRDRAYAAGNLATDERQEIVAADDGTITIAPADPEVIYVPYYDPARVVVRHSAPVYHYYPHAYPVYYYPYPTGYSFGSSLFWGVTSAFMIGWHDHYLHVRHNSHFGHPYYGYNYYSPWYSRTNIYVNVNRVGSYNRWRPGYRYGGRPRHHAGYDRLRDRRIIDAPRDSRVRSARLRDRQIRRNAESRELPRNRTAANTARNGRLAPNRVRNQPRTDRGQARPRQTDRATANTTRNGRLQPNRPRNQRATGNGQARPTLRERNVQDRRAGNTPTRVRPQLGGSQNRVARSGAGRTQAPREIRQTPNRARQLANRGRDVAPRGNASRGSPTSPATRNLQTQRRAARATPNRSASQNRGRTLSSPRTAQRMPSNANRSSGMLGRSAAPPRRATPQRSAPRSARSGFNREQPIRAPAARQARPSPAPAARRGANTRVQPRAQQNRARTQPRRAAQPSRGSNQRSVERGRRAR